MFHISTSHHSLLLFCIAPSHYKSKNPEKESRKIVASGRDLIKETHKDQDFHPTPT